MSATVPPDGTHPEEESGDRRDAQGRGVVAQPGEVHADLDAEVFRDLV
jgi:hypothetical protein